MSYSRIKRIDQQLKEELSFLIRKDIYDARAQMISITQVDMVRDYSVAKVYVTYLGPLSEREEIIDLLHHHGGDFRRKLGKALRLHTIPRFHFVYDNLLEKSNELSSLIEEAIHEDEAKQEKYQKKD